MTNSKERFVGFSLLVLYAASLVIFSYREGLTAYSKILGVVIIAFFGATIIRRANRGVFPMELVVLLAWLMWAAVSSILAVDIDIAFDKLMTLVQVLLLSVVLCSVFVWQKKMTSFWIAFAVVALISSAITLSNPDAFIDKSGRISGTVGNANLYGFVLTIGFVTSLALCLSSRRWIVRATLLAAVIFLFYMIAETGSRKAMLTSILAMATVLVIFAVHLKNRGGPKFVAFVAVSLIFLGGGIFFLSTSQHIDRLEGAITAAETGKTSAADGSLKTRAHYIRLAFEHTLENPITGVGLDNFRTLRSGLTDTIGSYSHSNYMEVMVSTGIPGLLLYVLIYAILIVKIIRVRQCIFSDDLVGPYAIAAAIILIIVAWDFAMVSYYEKLPWLIIAGTISQVELMRRSLSASSV